MPRRALLLAGTAALSAVPAYATVSDFHLPPSADATPTPAPNVQGPVDPDFPAANPAPAATPSPTPAPRPTAQPTTTPVIEPVPPSPTPTPRAESSPALQSRPAPRETTTPAPLPTPQVSPTAESSPAPAFTPAPGPSAAPANVEPAGEEGGLPWYWLGALAGFLVVLGGVFYWARRRGLRPRGSVLMVPEIERPRVPEKPPEPTPDPEPAESPAAAAAAAAQPANEAEALHPLHILIEPRKLTQTMMNLALSYRLELTNRGENALENLVVAADFLGAHASLPREAQLAGPDSALPEIHHVTSLAPNETTELKGELRISLANLVPIQRGSAVIAVPLARFRASSDGEEPRCFTVVVGQPSANGAIQPFRLDQGLRSLEGLTGRAF
jgi:hypothetical protein